MMRKHCLVVNRYFREYCSLLWALLRGVKLRIY